MKNALLAGAAIVVSLTACPVAAQAPAPAPAVAAVPDRTTASFADWTLRCERPGQIANAPRVCEVAQSINVQGQQQPIAQIAIGRIQRTDPLRFTIVLPNNVLLTLVPKFATEETGGQLVDTVWQRCLPGGCVADTVLKDDVLKRLKARTDPGRIEFKDAVGRDVKLPFSTRGLAQALDALAKE